MKHIFIGLGLMLSMSANAQTEKPELFELDPNYGKFRYFQLITHSGIHIYTGESLDDILEGGYGSIEARLGWQTKGEHPWETPFNNMSYGIGWYAGAIGDPEILGSPNALYGFADFPLSYGKKSNQHLGIALGLSYDLNPYNPEDNPTNDAIGSRIDVYFNLAYGWRTQLNRELDLLYGIDFTHFSNGRTSTPNMGLNMFGLHLGVEYKWNAMQKEIDKDLFTKRLLNVRPQDRMPSEPEVRKEHKVQIYYAAGTVQNNEQAGTDERFLTSSIVLEYQYELNSMHGFSGGLDVFYDASLEPKYPESSDWWIYGIHGGYDFMFYRFSIRAQVGTYLSDDRGKGAFWLRPAVKYDITDKLYAQVGLKTFAGAAADWVEYGIGVQLF
jgi:hypothetical protein